MKLKVGDKVRIITGTEKGKEGKITQVFPKDSRVIVEAINMKSKHLKGRKGSAQKGQKVEFAAPIHISNVALVGSSVKFGRVGMKMLKKDGKLVKTRVLHKAGKVEDIA
jgi:large subunit ribosomal protein L24